MTLRELLQQRAERTDRLEAIYNDAAEREDVALTEEEQTEEGAIESEVRNLNIQIERREKLMALTDIGDIDAMADAIERDTRQMAGNRDRTETRDGAPAFHQNPTPDQIENIFCRYLRTGSDSAADEIRAYNNTDMNVTTAADGEVAVPVGMVRDIVARRDEMMLAPKLGVRNVPGKGTTVNYPIDNEADVVFTVVTEAGTVNQDAPALTEKAFTLAKYGKYLTLSWELLRDEDAMLLDFISNWIARGWAGTHNSLLVTEVLANGTAGLTLDAAAAIGAAEVPELIGKVLPEYQDGSQWIMHPTTYAYLTGLTGNPFYFRATPAGNVTGPQLGGYSVNQSSYMTALGAGVKSMVFGNWFFMGKREGTTLQTLRNPYTTATTGQVRLHYWFDAVYGVLQAEALQYATHPTA